jgi:methylglutaconyl-CoA hydratase
MSSTEALLLTTHDAAGVATLTLNRTGRHNALSAGLIDALADALATLEAEPRVRVVVLTGAGNTFCAGADIEEMREAADASVADNERTAARLADLLARLDQLAKPTVARVQGNAFGGALGLISACDIAIAADTAWFALTEVRLGLVPAMISPYVVRAIGERQARRYFLTAERMDAAMAERTGLLHRVVPAAELDAAVAGITAELLRGAPGAQAEAKQLLRHVTGRSAAGDRDMATATARWIARLRAGEEGREGLSAFLERRPPAWRRD